MIEPRRQGIPRVLSITMAHTYLGQTPPPKPESKYCPCGQKLSRYNKTDWCNLCHLKEQESRLNHLAASPPRNKNKRRGFSHEMA